MICMVRELSQNIYVVSHTPTHVVSHTLTHLVTEYPHLNECSPISWVGVCNTIIEIKWMLCVTRWVGVWVDCDTTITR